MAFTTSGNSATVAFQQQVFALDAKYNAHRAPNNPNFRTLYIRRRSQLLREVERSLESWKQYLSIRSHLLQQRYASPYEATTCAISRSRSRGSLTSDVRLPLPISFSAIRGSESVVPTHEAEASRAMVGGNSIADNYAFVGVHHIFDQHTQAITMVKFANNDKSRLCCSSLDGNLSLYCLNSSPPAVIAVLKGHTKSVTGFDWSANNDLIASSSLDCTIKVWNVAELICLRTIHDMNGSALLCCLFQPVNNNLLISGNTRGEVQVANVSTGLFMKTNCRVGGNILCLCFDTYGKILWTGNDKGEIISVVCDAAGELHQTRRFLISQSCAITSISYRVWISREARDPMLLVNYSENVICLFRVVDQKGSIQLKRKFNNKHEKHLIKSTFCPIMSFRQGACIVTGSEDGIVYFLNIDKPGNRACLNTLQGHSSPVLDVTFNYDESLLATCDLQGLVIVWKRAVET